MVRAMSKNLSRSFKFCWQFLRSQTVTLLLGEKNSEAPEFHNWHMRLKFKNYKSFVFNPVLGFG
jgi:hypothetical protein